MISSEISLRNKLANSLITRGYPKNSLNYEWQSGKINHDLAVVDPVTGELLAIFELKVTSPAVVSSEPLRQMLAKFKAFSHDKVVPLFMVHAIQGGDDFTIGEVLYQTKDLPIPEIITLNDLPDFETLRNSVLGVKRKRAWDFFRIRSYLLAGIVSLLLILDWTSQIELTGERLALIGVIVSLIILPDAYRLKILGFEFEREPKSIAS